MSCGVNRNTVARILVSQSVFIKGIKNACVPPITSSTASSVQAQHRSSQALRSRRTSTFPNRIRMIRLILNVQLRWIADETVRSEWEDMNHLRERHTETMNLLDRFLGILRSTFAEILKGVYLHGSLAMDCFNPSSSDIDLLILLHDRATIESIRDLAEATLVISRNPHPFEYSVLHAQQLIPWRHPTPFDFHYGEDWRFRMTEDLISGDWHHWYSRQLFDPDLAAHITMIHHRGICLEGVPIADAFPEVPSGHFEMALAVDLAWARQQIDRNPLYAILNHCRAWAYHEGRLFLSKCEGIEWASERVPADYRPVTRMAGTVYREGGADRITPRDATEFCAFVCTRIGSLAHRME